MAQRRELQPLLANLKRQGTKVLTALQQEITKREKTLTELKATAARWKEAVGGQTRTMGAAAPSQIRGGRKRRRIDWSVALASLPASFNAKDVQRQTGKPMEQVYAGVSRWAKDKKVKKNPNGTYQKTSAAPPSAQQKKG
jgi:hypothetical protein